MQDTFTKEAQVKYLHSAIAEKHLELKKLTDFLYTLRESMLGEEPQMRKVKKDLEQKTLAKAASAKEQIQELVVQLAELENCPDF